jgi:hypothetical protein
VIQLGKEKIFFENKEGIRIAATYCASSTDSPIAILCHGFRSSMNSPGLCALEKKLVAEGFATMKFDFRGHGESGGNFEELIVGGEVDDLNAAISFVEKNVGKRIGVVGSSLSGLVSIIQASRDSRIKVLALRAPVSDFKALYSANYDIIGWKKNGFTTTYSRAGKAFKLNYAFYEEGLKYDAYELAEKIRAPTLIVHGDKDDSVPLEQSEKLLKHLRCEKKLVVIKGGTHFLGEVEEHARIQNEAVAEWFKKRL